jgi:hypothetical protein
VEKRVILVAVLLLVGLGAYQAATGGVRPSVDFTEAKAGCMDALDRALAIHNGSPLPHSETLSTYELKLTDCRNKSYLSADQVRDLLGS